MQNQKDYETLKENIFDLMCGQISGIPTASALPTNLALDNIVIRSPRSYMNTLPESARILGPLQKSKKSKPCTMHYCGIYV